MLKVDRLTNRTLKAAKPAEPGRSYYLMERHLPGLGVRIFAESRSYVIRYRGVTAVLGAVALYSIDEARELARNRMREIDGKLQAGEKPGRQTLETLRQAHLAEHVEPHLAPKTREEYRRLWGQACSFVVPSRGQEMGTLRLSQVRRDEVVELHLAHQDRPYLANRMLALLSNAFTLAEAKGWVTPGRNPTQRVTRFPERARDRVYSAEERERIHAAISRLVAEGSILRSSALYLLTLDLTGCRPGEPLRWTWDRIDEVEVEGTVLGRVRQATAKGDRRARRRKGRVVWLPERLLRELQGLRRGEEPWVYPGRSVGQPLTGAQRAWEAVQREAGLVGTGATLYAFRHTWRTDAVGVLPPELTADLLGQRTPDITEDYRHSPASAQAKAAVAMSSERLRAWAKEE